MSFNYNTLYMILKYSVSKMIANPFDHIPLMTVLNVHLSKESRDNLKNHGLIFSPNSPLNMNSCYYKMFNESILFVADPRMFMILLNILICWLMLLQLSVEVLYIYSEGESHMR